jgi:hypothetical protein
MRITLDYSTKKNPQLQGYLDNIFIENLIK